MGTRVGQRLERSAFPAIIAPVAVRTDALEQDHSFVIDADWIEIFAEIDDGIAIWWQRHCSWAGCRCRTGAGIRPGRGRRSGRRNEPHACAEGDRSRSYW